jgi:hypothetical protein
MIPINAVGLDIDVCLEVIHLLYMDEPYEELDEMFVRLGCGIVERRVGEYEDNIMEHIEKRISLHLKEVDS